MKQYRIKNNIAYLFLVLFLTMKMAGLHVFSHGADESHEVPCVICDLAVANNLTPALSPDVQDFNIENTEPIVLLEIITNYSYIISNTIEANQLFSRPPPFLL